MPKPQVYGPLELPSGRKITFRKPMRADRNNATISADIDALPYAIGMMQIEDLVKATCLVTDNGKEPDENPKRRFNDWTDDDVEFYVVVFNKMFGMNDEKVKKAEEQAAFLLNNLTSTNGSNSTDASVSTVG